MLRYVTRHPLNRGRPMAAIWRIASWQVRSRIARRPLTVPFVDDTKLLVSRGMTGATGNVYCGLHEFEEMSLVMHALRPGDLFLDVGANVGAYTILAAGVAGADAVAIEPVPATAESLRMNIAANRLDERVSIVQSTVGAHEGTVRFTVGLDSMNHVARSDEAATSIELPMTTLDTICIGRSPTVAKIDVEGHEREVLRGAQLMLASQTLQALVVEVWEDSRDEVSSVMPGFGFAPFSYEPTTRQLTAGRSAGSSNVVFVRDEAWLADRCRSAPRRLVRPVGKSI